MKMLSLHEMGEVIRKIRKERGLRLEDLADENISPATVSNIERGVTHVSPEKIAYLLEKLELSLTKLPEIFMKEQEENQKIKFQLLVISSLTEMGNIERALNLLEKLDLEDTHPYASKVIYIKGICYLYKKKWKQAERYLYNALRNSQQSNMQNVDLDASIYLQLSECQAAQGNVEEALERIEHGLKSIQEQEVRQEIMQRLICKKAKYLLELGRILEGSQLIQSHWEEISKAKEEETRLTFYWLKAEFLAKIGHYENAVCITSQALEFAKKCNFPRINCSLWTLLGSLHTQMDRWDLAELFYQMALDLEAKLTEHDVLVRPFSEIGLLYHKRNRLKEAYTYIEKAVTYAKKYKMTDAYLQNLLFLGNLCQEIHQKQEEAIRILQQAAQLAQNYYKPALELEIWHSLARCYESKNEEAFQHCLRRAFEIKKKWEASKESNKLSLLPK